MAAHYPKMMYDKEYADHLHPSHEMEIAVKRRAHTCLVSDPQDQAEKEAQGWRDTHDPAAFADLEADVAAAAEPEENPSNSRRRGKTREAVATE